MATWLAEIPLAHELLALLDHRLGKRLGEFALGQDEFVGLTQAGLLRLIARGKGHAHFEAGPGMGGQVLRGLAFDQLGIDLGQLQRHERSFEQGIGLLLAAVELRSLRRQTSGFFGIGQRKAGLGARHAMIVGGAEAQAERAARRGGRVAHESNLRHAVLDEVEAPFGDGVAADPHIDSAGRGEGQLEFQEPLAAGDLRNDRVRRRAVLRLRHEAHGFAAWRKGAHD